MVRKDMILSLGNIYYNIDYKVFMTKNRYYFS